MNEFWSRYIRMKNISDEVTNAIVQSEEIYKLRLNYGVKNGRICNR